MEKPQIAVRISPSLLDKLNSYIEKTGTTKTDVVINALAQYIGCIDSVPLTQRMAELERQMKELRDLVKK
jgi:predicted DNA-binding protein